MDTDGSKFAVAPDPIAISSFVRARAGQLRLDHQAWEAVRSGWPNPPETALRLHVGPMATGSSVLSDEDEVDRIISQNRSLLAIEMEAYGVVAASIFAPHPRPTTFAIKSVCDFGDSAKNDQWQAYAAYSSARAVKIFFERYMGEISSLAGTR